jgi:Glycosyl transferase family 2
MWRGARVAVVVPAYQEERIIQRMLHKLPPYLDCIYVVDDASRDATRERVASSQDPRICLLRQRENRGVGAAIGTGYRRALAEGFDLVTVMAAESLPASRGASHAETATPRQPAALELHAPGDVARRGRLPVSGLRPYHVLVVSGVIARRWWRGRSRGWAISFPKMLFRN